MSITINRRVGTEKLFRVLTRRYAEKWRGFKIEGEVTVITIDDEVIRLSTVMRALKKAERGASDRFLFVGRDFTQEARALLLERSIPVLDLQYFGWTDASHLSIRVGLGAKVKLPNHTPEPTPMSITPPAGAGGPPATAAAHL
jgi:hypothetical protein